MEELSRQSVYPVPFDRLSIEEAELRGARLCLIWGWCLVGGGCCLAVIPLLGLLVWFVATPLVIAGLALAIIAIVKGRTAAGITLLLFSLFVAPFTFLFGPILSLFLGAVATSHHIKPPAFPSTSPLPASPATPHPASPLPAESGEGSLEPEAGFEINR